jgi:TonB family protein
MACASWFATAMIAVIVAASPVTAVSTDLVAPGLPPAAGSGAEVVLHVELDAAGAPARIDVILDGPPFGEALRDAVRRWRLEAAPAGGGHVLVAGVFRSAALLEVRPLPDPPDAESAPRAIPAPVAWARPPYPPDATGGAVVIVQALVGEDGVPRETTVVVSAPGFDAAALEAAGRWRFRPAYRDERPAAAVVYLVFGFPEPVTRRPG